VQVVDAHHQHTTFVPEARRSDGRFLHARHLHVIGLARPEHVRDC
jgi:hypothetical protein